MLSAGRVAAGATHFVTSERLKPLLLERAWLLGNVALGYMAVLAVLMYVDLSSMLVNLLSLLSTFGTLAAALAAWWVCNSKKDDLNQKEQVDLANKELDRLKAAEARPTPACDELKATKGETIGSNPHLGLG